MNQRLSFWEKLSYGAGDLGPAIAANLMVVFQLIFFTNVAGLNPGLAGTVLLVGKVWDAVNDPLIGVLSDRTRNSWGRRLPWMFWGAIPFGVSFFFLWWVPQFTPDPEQNQWLLFWYYVLVAIAVNTFYTVVNLPYTALTAELTQDYDERTSLNSFRFGFSIGGQYSFAHFGVGDFSAFAQSTVATISGVGGGGGGFDYLAPVLVCGGNLPPGGAGGTDSPGNDAGNPHASLGAGADCFAESPVFVCDWHLSLFLVGGAKYGGDYSLFCEKLDGFDRPSLYPVVLAVQVTALIMLFVWAN
jgi:GPH family glycoside/pentoside/hexuronide:cation symporter